MVILLSDPKWGLYDELRELTAVLTLIPSDEEVVPLPQKLDKGSFKTSKFLEYHFKRLFNCRSFDFK